MRIGSTAPSSTRKRIFTSRRAGFGPNPSRRNDDAGTGSEAATTLSSNTTSNGGSPTSIGPASAAPPTTAKTRRPGCSNVRSQTHSSPRSFTSMSARLNPAASCTVWCDRPRARRVAHDGRRILEEEARAHRETLPSRPDRDVVHLAAELRFGDLEPGGDERRGIDALDAAVVAHAVSARRPQEHESVLRIDGEVGYRIPAGESDLRRDRVVPEIDHHYR